MRRRAWPIVIAMCGALVACLDDQQALQTSDPIYTNNYSDNLDSIDANGHVPVPDGPGMGVGYDWDFIEAHRSGVRQYP